MTDTVELGGPGPYVAFRTAGNLPDDQGTVHEYSQALDVYRRQIASGEGLTPADLHLGSAGLGSSEVVVAPAEVQL